MKQSFISYLYFTRKERLGSVVLLAFCAVVFAMPNIREWYQPQCKTDFTAFETAMNQSLAAVNDVTPQIRAQMEAQAQAICMMTQDFKRAFDAFAAKQKPRFEGN